MFLLCPFLLLLLNLSYQTEGAEPGLIVRVTKKGLDYGRVVGINKLQQKIPTIKIPDMNGRKGKRKYSVSGIRITNVGIPESQLSLIPDKRIRFSISNAYINIKGRWRARWRFIRTSGSFDLSVRGLSIVAEMEVVRDNSGRPSVRSTSCHSNIGKLKIKLRGRASWLYNIFLKFLNKKITKAVNKQLCPIVSSGISKLNEELQTMPTLVNIDKIANLDYSLSKSPVVTSNYIDLGLKGTFYNIVNRIEPPFSPQAFSLPNESNSMVYLGLSEFVGNSAGFVYFRSGMLKLKITDDMIPRSSPIRLTTNNLGVLIPEIAKRYPNLPVVIQIQPSKPPILNMQQNNLVVQAFGAMEFSAVLPGSGLGFLFQLNIEAILSGNIAVSGLKLTGSVQMNRFSLTLGRTEVGSFNTVILQTLIDIAMKVAVIPSVNEKLLLGFPLPTLKHVSFANPQIKINQGYLLISTDIIYKP